MSSYQLDCAWPGEKERLDALSAIYGRATGQVLRSLGLTEGWTCAEIGAGSGVVAQWLCDVVGPSGRVVATDLDTRFLHRLQAPNLEVLQHDIVTDQLEPEAYDLIHTRLLLMHLGENRARALANMVAALKPGGWLVAEEQDDVAAGALMSPPHDTALEVLAAMPALFRQLEMDVHYGRRLPDDLRAAGLSAVGAEGRAPFVPSGAPELAALTHLLHQVRDRLIAADLVTETQIDETIDWVSQPDRCWLGAPMLVAAWGQKAPQSLDLELTSTC